MTADPLRFSATFVRATLAAIPADVEFRARSAQVHAVERRRGIKRTGYRPISVRGEVVPDTIIVAYVHQEDEQGSSWYVINSMKSDGRSPYTGFDVPSEEAARLAVLRVIQEAVQETVPEEGG